MTKVIISTRKVQELRNQNESCSYTISIPTEWIEKNKIKKGESLLWEIDTEEPKSIVLMKQKVWE